MYTKLSNIISYIVHTHYKLIAVSPSAENHIRQNTIQVVDNFLIVYFVWVVFIQKAEYCFPNTKSSITFGEDNLACWQLFYLFFEEGRGCKSLSLYIVASVKNKMTI